MLLKGSLLRALCENAKALCRASQVSPLDRFVRE